MPITANEYFRQRFGCKVYKLALDGGMSCPNRDGTKGSRGCIFCSGAGSGDFAAARRGEAIAHPDVAALSVATRPDCLPEAVLELLARLDRLKPVMVELGLQTIHPATADFIRRCYPLSDYDRAVERLSALGLHTVVHVILGLPGENEQMMVQTAEEEITSE